MNSIQHNAQPRKERPSSPQSQITETLPQFLTDRNARSGCEIEPGPSSREKPDTCIRNRNKIQPNRGQSRIALPPCAVCKKPPKEPHAVYCCGAMYCHQCLVKKMSEASNRNEVAKCDNCNKPMGDPENKQNNRASQANSFSTVKSDQLDEPSRKKAKSVADVNTITLNQPPYRFQVYGNGNSSFPLWTPANIPMRNNFQEASYPSTAFLRSNGSQNYIETRPQMGKTMEVHMNTGQSAIGLPPEYVRSRVPPHGFSSSGSLHSGELPSISSSQSVLSGRRWQSSGGSVSSVNLPSIEVENRSILLPPFREEQLNRNLISLDGAAVSTRIESTGNRQYQIIKSETPITPDDFLPKPPNPYDVEEKKVKELEEIAARQITYKKEDIIMGPTCAICWDDSRKPVTICCCNRIFCESCLTEHFRMRPKCPHCNETFPSEKFPTMYKILESPKPIKAPTSLNTVVSKIDVEGILEKFKGLDEYALSKLINELSGMREEKYKEGKNGSLRTLSVGLRDLVKKYKFEILTIQKQMEAAIQDKKFLDGGYSKDCSLYGGPYPPSVSGLSAKFSDSSDNMPTIIPNESSDSIIQMKTERLKRHFDAFSSSYYNTYNRYSIYSNEDPDIMSQNRINSMIEVADGITKYARVNKVCSLNYDFERNSAKSIISSLEFDPTGERFVVTGVTKKIKIFNFDYVISNPRKTHTPLIQLVSDGKISSISWSPDKYEMLASSDYDGNVSIWNAEAAKVVKVYREHDKRCWSVNFNSYNPNLIASGSDDAKVKIWDLKNDRSVAQIEARVNVCSVQFSPYHERQLIFGSADHGVHLYDLRNVGKPVNIYRGHGKAVSYVRYIGVDQIVSASTDSSLRVWSINESRCTKVLKGHINDKNFVGLGGNGDHVVCGSENARAFIYYKGLSEPLAEYIMGKENAPSDDSEGFVSSVCWKKETDYILAATSLGSVHVLQAC